MNPDVSDICRRFMLLVWRSACHSGTRQEAEQRRADYARRYGEDPAKAFERWKAEANA